MEKGTWYWDKTTRELKFEKTATTAWFQFPVLSSECSKNIQNDGKTVTLQDIKKVAVQLVSQKLLHAMSIKSVEVFDECYHTMIVCYVRFIWFLIAQLSGFKRTNTVDEFLWLVLEYFHWHLIYEKVAYDEALDTHGPVGNAARKELSMTIEKFEQTKSNLSAVYINLITGMGMEFSHHLLQGRIRYSRTLTDKYLFEAIYEFTMFVVWITFGYQHWDNIHTVIGSLFRTSAFNKDIPIPTDSKQSYQEQSNEYLTWRVFNRRPPQGKLFRIKSPAIKFIHAPPDDVLAKAKAVPEDKTRAIVSIGIIGQPMENYDFETLKLLKTVGHSDKEK